VRLMAKVSIPFEGGEKSAALPLKMQVAMQTLKPESAYFVEGDGKYECFFVFNLDFASLLQPLFPDVDATFQVTPAMNVAEFQRAVGEGPPKQEVVGEPEVVAEPEVVGEPELLNDLSPDATGIRGRHEPGDGEARYGGTPSGETAKKR
jgi:hypothetical protein